MTGILRNFVLPHATPIAFLVAYGELAIGLALVLLGLLVRPASVCGIVFMLTLLFSSNYPGPHAPFWQYFGASLDHSVLAMCFATFVAADAGGFTSIRRVWGKQSTSAAGGHAGGAPDERNPIGRGITSLKRSTANSARHAGF